MSKIHGIYIPGLGDHRSFNQEKACKLWSWLYGLDLEYYPLGWADKEPFQPKLDRLVKHIDELHKQHGRIVLVGASAGGSAILNTYAACPDKIRAVVAICGKFQNPKTVGRQRFTQNPAFKDSMDLLPQTFKKLEGKPMKRVLSVKPIFDGTVPPADTHIPGARQLRIHSIGHFLSIAWGLTLGSRGLARFIHSA